jgi:hypothetical protein
MTFSRSTLEEFLHDFGCTVNILIACSYLILEHLESCLFIAGSVWVYSLSLGLWTLLLEIKRIIIFWYNICFIGWIRMMVRRTLPCGCFTWWSTQVKHVRLIHSMTMMMILMMEKMKLQKKEKKKLGAWWDKD